MTKFEVTLLLLPLLSMLPVTAQTNDGAAGWTIYIANDACSDYTWGFNEEQSRRAYADVVRAHLDEMQRTDHEKPENQDRYNLSITQEADAFVEYYPERKQELIRRIKEGRISVGPVYNNALWGFQSSESVIRTFYPARRLERDWGIPLSIAQHIEQPGLPWGAASILAASGFQWLSAPFLDYDSTFSQLNNPTLFVWEGPDGATVKVVMDNFASHKANYVQGAYILKDPKRISEEWLPHYTQLKDYPVRAILASGTHGDNNPTNGNRAAGFAEAIIQYNSQSAPHAKLVNATLPMFFAAVDKAHPALPTLRGDFGHSWDLWPVTLAKYAAGARIGEHALLAAETLLACASSAAPSVIAATREEREKAEWNWIMVADHAWNGTDTANKNVNAELRRRWSEELNRLARDLNQKAWTAAGLTPDPTFLTIFNSLSSPRADLVRIEAPEGVAGVALGAKDIPAQIVDEDGDRVLYFVSPAIDGFAFATLQTKPKLAKTIRPALLRASATELESPRYRLRIHTATGGIASLIDKSTGKELLVNGTGHTIGQTVFFDGKEHQLSNVRSAVEAIGPVLARLKVTGLTEGIEVATHLTVYAELDRVDLDIRIHKPVTTQEHRVTQMFPVSAPDAEEHLDTMGAVERPKLQPDGDLLPGADTRRFAVQGFVDTSVPGGSGVTVASLESFALRRDLGNGITFEALGNDQNYKESTRDQHGVTDFQFRYSLRAHAGAYNNAEIVGWSRAVSTPLLAAFGKVSSDSKPTATLDPRRAIALAFKPAEERGHLLRIWEIAGRSGPTEIRLSGYRDAILTDLLERDLNPLPIHDGHITLDLRANGFAAVRLIP
jgi:alpha-mannosidase